MGFDIFINYRTADAAFGAAATYELLAERFGRDRIFLDNQSLGPGADYPHMVRAALESVRVLLVLIGPNWLASDSTHQPLLDRDNDWVRHEIRRALQRNIPVVPVLLDGAALPPADMMPADVRRVVHHQTVAIRHQHLGADVARLANRLTDLVPGGTRPGPPTPHQLPADSGRLVGREAEFTRLTTALGQDTNLMVISGTAGVGKTGLAVRWAHHTAHQFPDGQLYVDLRGYGTERPLSAAEALAGLLRTLGVARPEELVDTDERAARYRTLLSERKVLVLLDNARSVAQVRPLLPGGGPSVVLVTSRHQLGGLAVHRAAEQLPLSPLDTAAAVDLLQAIVGERVTAEPDAAAELARHCSNLPLALRIAAQRAGVRPTLRLADLVAELTDEHARLDVLGSGEPYSTVRTVFSWSYQGLDGPAAAAFRALGAHPGHTVDLAAVAALTGADTTAPVTAAVTTLIDAHLVTELTPGRYTTHDLLHVYAREIASTHQDERETSLRRLFDHYLHTAERADRLLTPHRFRVPLDGDQHAGFGFRDATEAREWVERERENLVAMCRVDNPAFDSRRWQLAFVLRGYFYLTKRLDGWTDTHTQALAACLRAGDGAAEAVTRNNLGMALVARGRLADAMFHYQRAERLFRTVADAHGMSNALVNQASVLRRLGRHDDALRNQRQALAHYQRSGAQRNTGITLRSMARTHADAGHLDDAVRCAEDAVDVALGLDDDLDIAQAYNVLGMAQHRVGNGAHAEIALHQAIEFSRRCASRHEEARAAHRLGALNAESNRPVEARRWWGVARDRYRELGSTAADAVDADLAGLAHTS